MPFLLDTNICIYLRRRRPPAIVTRFAALRPGDAAMSVITWGELRTGAAKSATPDAALAVLGELAELIPPLPLPPEAGEAYGHIRATLERAGRTIGGNDLWIAAHALAGDHVLVTNNEREFRRIDGLQVENWVR